MAARGAEHVRKGFEVEAYGVSDKTSEEENAAEIEQASSSKETSVEDYSIADPDFDIDSDTEGLLQEIESGTWKRPQRTFARTGKFAVLLSFLIYEIQQSKQRYENVPATFYRRCQQRQNFFGSLVIASPRNSAQKNCGPH